LHPQARFVTKPTCGCPHPNPQIITVAATPTTQPRRFLFFHPSQGFNFFKTGDSVSMMFALSAEYEMAALIASILFGFGAAVWFWMELH
tara:strand:+ start:1343 stop:1609 length:267 start_codon:yes stop_codon:yes gene_type:complete